MCSYTSPVFSYQLIEKPVFPLSTITTSHLNLFFFFVVSEYSELVPHTLLSCLPHLFPTLTGLTLFNYDSTEELRIHKNLHEPASSSNAIAAHSLRIYSDVCLTWPTVHCDELSILNCMLLRSILCPVLSRKIITSCLAYVSITVGDS